MSGHRRGTGKPVRAGERVNRFQRLLTEAQTVEQQAALAWDWWRSAAKHCPDRDELFAEMATRLANEANKMDGRA